MKPNFIQSWQGVVPGIQEILKRMQEKTIIALGIAPYTRIIPSLFLQNYQIYSVKDTADLDVLRKYATIFCLEEKFPKIAPKIHATNYLLGNYAFQAFLKSRRTPFKLMFYQTTPPIVKKLEEQHVEWIGNRPESFQEVFLKGSFREVIKKLGLPHLEDWRIEREEFLSKTYKELLGHWNRPVVVQRADFDVSGEQGTFFIKTQEDWEAMHHILSSDTRFTEIQMSPFVEGNSVSMLGCITRLGVLTSPLQLQLIDVPEALHGQLATGVFLGHDWGFHPWDEKAQKDTQVIVEKVGEFLLQKGFLGIFGVDCMYDEQTKQVLPLECNPRFTGALPVYSLMILQQNKVPPMEFFHLMAHLGIEEDFDFEAVNDGLKQRLPVSHISLTPKGAYEMKLPLVPGIYSYSPAKRALTYKRQGAFLWELQDDSEFLIIDSVPRTGGNIIQNVPRLFKLIFPRSIAISSFTVQQEIGELITNLSDALRKDQAPPQGQELGTQTQEV